MASYVWTLEGWAPDPDNQPDCPTETTCPAPQGGGTYYGEYRTVVCSLPTP